MTINEVRILAYDPGITYCGWALNHFDIARNHHHIKQHGTLTNRDVLKRQKELKGIFSPAFITLDAYHLQFVDHIITYAPHFVVTEGAFMHKFPKAFASLVMVIHEIRKASRLCLNQDVQEIAPQENKRIVSTKASSDKDAMAVALAGMNNVTIDHDAIRDTSSVLGDMSTHAVDAACVSISFAIDYLPSIVSGKGIVDRSPISIRKYYSEQLQKRNTWSHDHAPVLATNGE